MPDDNQQPNWLDEQKRGREIMAEQQAEIDEAKEEVRAKKQRAEEAADTENDQTAQENGWSLRLATTKNAERMSVAPDMEDGRPLMALKELETLDKAIANLKKKTNTDYIMPYLLLTTTAATIDAIQAVADLSVLLALFASGAGITFSVIRHYGLKYANHGASQKEHNAMFSRTLISGAISMIPIVDILPEQTMFMIREWTVKKMAIAAANQEMAKLNEQRKKIVASLPR